MGFDHMSKIYNKTNSFKIDLQSTLSGTSLPYALKKKKQEKIKEEEDEEKECSKSANSFKTDSLYSSTIRTDSSSSMEESLKISSGSDDKTKSLYMTTL
jgi:hypothetical protein